MTMGRNSAISIKDSDTPHGYPAATASSTSTRPPHEHHNWDSGTHTLRLARYFGTTPRFWLNLQAQYDLDRASDRLGDRLEHEVAAHAEWRRVRGECVTRTGRIRPRQDRDHPEPGSGLPMHALTGLPRRLSRRDWQDRW